MKGRDKKAFQSWEGLRDEGDSDVKGVKKRPEQARVLRSIVTAIFRKTFSEPPVPGKKGPIDRPTSAIHRPCEKHCQNTPTPKGTDACSMVKRLLLLVLQVMRNPPPARATHAHTAVNTGEIWQQLKKHYSI